MAEPGLSARRAALRLIDEVVVGRKLLSEALPRVVGRLPAEERARAQRLATETLRWASRADRVLGPYLRLNPGPEALNVLRLAVVEMLAEGAAAHGVVNAAVTLAREDKRTEGKAGLVNAVLRKIAARPPEWGALALPTLPKWLRKPLLADYGKAVVAAIEAAQAAPVPLDLTVRRGEAGIAGALGAEVLPTGTLRLHGDRQVSALPGYAEGLWWVQDAAAAIPARMLDARPGERVLDLCAAPGGKTLQLADAGAEVTALDISERRMERVRENLARTGLSAELVVADALDWTPEAPFDAVLLDAPCSATGTMRRHPDLPYAKDGSEFPELFELQRRMIDRALDLVRPGGRVVYCTCSLLIDEGEEQVRDALARHPGLTVEPPEIDGLEPEWIDALGGLRLRPDFWAEKGGMDGFYAAVLRKPA